MMIDLAALCARLRWSRRTLARFLRTDEKALREVELGQRQVREEWQARLKAADQAARILDKAGDD